MNQRYVDTVRACKTILHNIHSLEQSISPAQHREISRLFVTLHQQLEAFLREEEDLGAWVGEELPPT